MACSKCSGCPSCGEVPGLPPPAPGAPGAPEGGTGPRPRFKVISKRITYNTAAVNKDLLVVSVPAATAVDVFVRYRDDQNPPNIEDPFSGVEQWKLFAKTGQATVQIGDTIETREVSIGNDDCLVARQLFAVQLPAEGFDLLLNGNTIAAGNVLYFDVTIIAWGTEPTGIGPERLTPVVVGGNPPTDPIRFTGIAMVGRDQATGSDVWEAITFNQTAIQDPNANPPESGFSNLNVLPIGQYLSSPPTMTNGQFMPLQTNAQGALKVTVVSSSSTTSKFTSTAYEADHVGTAVAQTVRSIYVYSRAAAAGWIFIFDSATLPPNGTVPDFPPIPIAGGPAFVSLELEEGRTHAAGLVVAFSSTANTLTLASADCWFEAHWST